MSDGRDLYLNAIVDHYKAPRNYHELEGANRHANGHNPLCGDKVSIFFNLVNNRIAGISFTGNGCAIATASASMMTENIKGKTEKEARAVVRNFLDLLSGDYDPGAEGSLGNLSVFTGVRGYPSRIKCAALAWHTFLAALEGKLEIVATE